MLGGISLEDEKIDKNVFLSNIITAFLAQGVSLILSLFMSFIIPKFLGIIEYSYWQLFIFYIGYVGLFHFGFNDGIYLRWGGKNYNELNYEQLGTQFKILALIECFIALIIGIVTCIREDGIERKYVWIFVSIYLIFNNLHLFYGYVFQAVNKTKIYSKSIILDRICVLTFVILLLIRKETHFIPFVSSYTISKIISFIYLSYKGKDIFFAHCGNIKEALKDMYISLECGIKLVFANIMSMLVLGIGRIMIDNVWGIEAFGKISFSLSLTNFFLVFIQQISMVLFPTLRRITEKQQKNIYNIIRTILGFVFPLAFICYFPIKYFVNLWLPQYDISIRYLVLLLPLCTFDGKMQMLCNTYLKVFRQEKMLLKLNIISFFTSLFFCFISAYIFKNMTLVVISMVCSVALRSIMAEIYLAKMMDAKILKMLIQEIFLVVIFIGSAWFLNEKIAFIIVIIEYIVFILSNKRSYVHLKIQ